MPKLSTPFRLLRFAYNETSIEENIQLINKVSSSAKAQDTLSTIYASMTLLDGLKKSPTTSVMDNILSYAKH